ncbi:MAG: hypothetical protein WCR04_12230, partial [Fibrobacteraceae bacterium]
MEQRDTATISGNTSHWWTKVLLPGLNNIKSSFAAVSAFATVVSQSGEERSSRRSQVANSFGYHDLRR